MTWEVQGSLQAKPTPGESVLPSGPCPCCAVSPGRLQLAQAPSLPKAGAQLPPQPGQGHLCAPQAPCFHETGEPSEAGLTCATDGRSGWQEAVLSEQQVDRPNPGNPPPMSTRRPARQPAVPAHLGPHTVSSRPLRSASWDRLETWGAPGLGMEDSGPEGRGDLGQGPR